MVQKISRRSVPFENCGRPQEEALFFELLYNVPSTLFQPLRVLKGVLIPFPSELFFQIPAQIPQSSLCCSNWNPIPIFLLFLFHKSQSQWTKSHFPASKKGKSQLPLYTQEFRLGAGTAICDWFINLCHSRSLMRCIRNRHLDLFYIVSVPQYDYPAFTCRIRKKADRDMFLSSPISHRA